MPEVRYQKRPDSFPFLSILKWISPIILAGILGLGTYFATTARADTRLTVAEQEILILRENSENIKKTVYTFAPALESINSNIAKMEKSLKSLPTMQQDIAVLKAKEGIRHVEPGSE